MLQRVLFVPITRAIVLIPTPVTWDERTKPVHELMEGTDGDGVSEMGIVKGHQGLPLFVGILRLCIYQISDDVVVDKVDNGIFLINKASVPGNRPVDSSEVVCFTTKLTSTYGIRESLGEDGRRMSLFFKLHN